MAALSAARNTPKMEDIQRAPLPFPVKGSTTIYQGSLVALNGGYAAPGAGASSRIAVGRAKTTVDNSAGSDGDLTVEVEEGIFHWANKSGDEVVAADVGSSCYLENDQTVRHTSTSSSAAGKVVKIDSTGVWVKTTL